MVKKSIFSRVINALKDKEELKSPIIIKHGNSMDSEIAHLQRKLSEGNPEVDLKKIEKQIKFLKIGNAGEQSLLFELKNSFLPIMILHDVYIEYKGLTAQYDFIVVTRQFILVVEVKKYFGNITVNEKGEFIRTVKRGSRTVFQEGIYSPIRQVERQVEVLQMMLVDNEIIKRTPIHYAVAFANEKTVIDLKNAPKEIKDKVFRSDGIVSFLKAELSKKSPVHFMDGKMQELAEYINEQHVNKHLNEDSQEQEINFYEEVEVAAAVVEEVVQLQETNADLELILKEFRKKIAEETGRKAFYIFTNKTLDDLMEKRPTTLEELRQIQGIGDKKIEEFGDKLVMVIKESELEG